MVGKIGNTTKIGRYCTIYGLGLDEVLVMTDASTSEDYYYLHDHLHSPVALLDLDGEVIERYEYDAYGKPTYWEGDYSYTIEATGIGNPYYFTGRRIDFVGVSAFMIQYNRGRFLDYYTGCWLNEDPIGYQDGPNLYTYVHSNPVNKMDPQGLCEADCDPGSNDSEYDWCVYQCNALFPPFTPGNIIVNSICKADCVVHYPNYGLPNDLPPDEDYNCGGLAFRTFTQMPLDKVKEILKDRKVDCNQKCQPHAEKCWLWEFTEVKIFSLLEVGNRPIGFIPSIPPTTYGPGWHIVCGECGPNGEDPTECCSKPNALAGIVRDDEGQIEYKSCGKWEPQTIINIQPPDPLIWFLADPNNKNYKFKTKITVEARMYEGQPTCYCGYFVF